MNLENLFDRCWDFVLQSFAEFRNSCKEKIFIEDGMFIITLPNQHKH